MGKASLPHSQFNLLQVEGRLECFDNLVGQPLIGADRRKVERAFLTFPFDGFELPHKGSQRLTLQVQLLRREKPGSYGLVRGVD